MSDERTQIVAAAISDLDPTNDDHWNADKSPRLAALKAIGCECSKAEATAAMKFMSTPDEPLPPAETPPVDDTDPSTEPLTEDETPPPFEEEPNNDHHKSLVIKAKQAIVDANTAIGLLSKTLSEAKRAFDEGLAALELAERNLEKLGSSDTNQSKISRYIKSQQIQRGVRASRLDATLGNRRNARGTVRPRRSLMGH